MRRARFAAPGRGSAPAVAPGRLPSQQRGQRSGDENRLMKRNGAEDVRRRDSASSSSEIEYNV